MQKRWKKSNFSVCSWSSSFTSHLSWSLLRPSSSPDSILSFQSPNFSPDPCSGVVGSVGSHSLANKNTLDFLSFQTLRSPGWCCLIKLNTKLSSFLLPFVVLLRRRRESSGRPKMRRRTRRSQQERRRTTTWSSVEFVKMEESCCAATPVRPPTTSTASTRLFLRSPTGSGYAPAAW